MSRLTIDVSRGHCADHLKELVIVDEPVGKDGGVEENRSCLAPSHTQSGLTPGGFRQFEVQIGRSRRRALPVDGHRNFVARLGRIANGQTQHLHPRLTDIQGQLIDVVTVHGEFIGTGVEQLFDVRMNA